MFEYEVSAIEANYWWRQTNPAGALLNKLMFLFIVVPIALVLKNFYALSLIIFALMIPYGMFVRYLAVCAVRHHLERHPDKQTEFEQSGIIF
jgi:predicted DNA repair protein MutK